MKYIVPTSKVLSVNTKQATLEEEVIATSVVNEEIPYDDGANQVHYDDAVDDLFKK